MSLQIVVLDQSTGQTLNAALQQVDSSGTLGDIWDETAGAWATPPVATADQKIALSETDLVYTGGKSTALGTITSDVVVRILGAADAVVGAQKIRIVGGVHVRENALNISPKTVSDQRTWHLRQQSDNVEATNVVVVSDSSAVTLAMDFSSVLNAGAGIQSVTSVTDTEATPITAANQAVSQDAMAVHFDIAAADLDAGEDGTFKVVAYTTDAQTVVGIGRLRVV